MIHRTNVFVAISMFVTTSRGLKTKKFWPFVPFGAHWPLYRSPPPPQSEMALKAQHPGSWAQWLCLLYVS